MLVSVFRLFFLPLLFAAGVCLSAETHPNVLFIAVDDLRPWLGCHDSSLDVSPEIDRLAAAGRRFSRHFVQVPTCGASRCALMFGRRGGTISGDLGNNACAAVAGKVPQPALPALFRSHGYRTVSVGKVTHHPGNLRGAGWAEGPEELSGAWDAAVMPCGPWKTPEAAMHGYPGGVSRDKMPGRPVLLEADGGELGCPDGWVAREAVHRLREAAAEDKPFFLAVGFIKPHLPFVYPTAWSAAATPLPQPAAPGKPAFPSTWHGSAEFRRYGFPDGDPFLSAEAAAACRRAYLSCIRYSDAQVGKLLDALAASPAADNTIVVLWGDHGWLLGEHGIWGKHCLFEEALHSPLIIRVLGQAQPGKAAEGVVETTDLYPTLAALAGLPTPEGLDGVSLVPQLLDPAAPTRGRAFSAWGDCRSIRTASHRLIVSVKNPDHLELYDHRTDPAEGVNAAAAQPEEAARLLETLRNHFPGMKK